MGAMLWGHVFPGGHCRMPWTHPYGWPAENRERHLRGCTSSNKRELGRQQTRTWNGPYMVSRRRARSSGRVHRRNGLHG